MDNRTYDNCRNFDTVKCPHRNHEALKSVAVDISQISGGKPVNLSRYFTKEIIKKTEEICKNCSVFDAVK